MGSSRTRSGYFREVAAADTADCFIARHTWLCSYVKAQDGTDDVISEVA